jgi:exopolysaccharide/PEP-CTERM locus tyrosine autokinase
MSKYYDLLKNSGVSLDKFPAGDSSRDDAANILRKPLRDVKSAPDLQGKKAGESCSLPGIDPTLVSMLEPDSIGADRFKKIRSRILLMAADKQIRTIMVTSAEPCDGKSFVAANLAVTISKGIDEHVLLVDADLHAPSLHSLFGLHPRGGLRDYLEGTAPLARFLMKTPVNKLTLLPAGEPTPSASELLGAMNMKALVQELRDRYDDRYIIFDSPPGQIAAETSLLAQTMDGVILVVRCEKTPKSEISKTIESIGREKVLGVVFNDSPDREKDYRYYYRYHQRREKRPT